MGRFPRPLVPLGQQAAVQPALAHISSVHALHLHRFTLDFLPRRNQEVLHANDQLGNKKGGLSAHPSYPFIRQRMQIPP